jgi:hypothetical protein
MMSASLNAKSGQPSLLVLARKRVPQFRRFVDQGLGGRDHMTLVMGERPKLDSLGRNQKDTVSIILTRQVVLLCGMIQKGGGRSTIPMKTMTYSWHESFMTAVIETDWTRMQARVQAAESEINERRHLLSENRGGTLEERQAIDEALICLQILRERCSFVAKLAAPLRFAGLEAPALHSSNSGSSTGNA